MRRSQFVRRAMDFQPLGGIRLVFANPIAHIGMKDLRTSARHAAQPRFDQVLQDLANRFLRQVFKPVDLDRRPGFQMQARKRVVQHPDDIDVPVKILLVMQTAHNVHLGTTVIDRFLAPSQDLLVIHHVSFGISQIRSKSTKRAPIDTDVGGIQVRIDVVVGQIAVKPLADQIGQLPDVVQRHLRTK